MALERAHRAWLGGETLGQQASCAISRRVFFFLVRIDGLTLTLAKYRHPGGVSYGSFTPAWQDGWAVASCLSGLGFVPKTSVNLLGSGVVVPCARPHLFSLGRAFDSPR